MTRPEDLAIPDLTDAEAAAYVALAEGRQPQPRPEDFYVTTRLLCCPVDGCPWHQAIGNWPGDLDGDLGSLLHAARDHLTNYHPNQPE